MVVPMKKNWSTSFWVFVKPIEPILWAAFLASFVFTGFVIWLVEHKESRDFGGSAWRQLVNIAYFSFQALLAVPKGELQKLLTIALANFYYPFCSYLLTLNKSSL
jgi:ionotropic glutamate receptor